MVLGITRTNNTTKKRTLYGANKEIKMWMMTLLEITKHVWISQQCCDLRGSHVFLISFFDMKEKTNVSNQNKSLVAVFWRPLDFNLKSFILKLAFWNPFLSQTSNLPIKDKQPHPSGVNDEWMMFFFSVFFSLAWLQLRWSLLSLLDSVASKGKADRQTCGFSMATCTLPSNKDTVVNI